MPEWNVILAICPWKVSWFKYRNSELHQGEVHLHRVWYMQHQGTHCLSPSEGWNSLYLLMAIFLHDGQWLGLAVCDFAGGFSLLVSYYPKEFVEAARNILHLCTDIHPVSWFSRILLCSVQGVSLPTETLFYNTVLRNCCVVPSNVSCFPYSKFSHILTFSFFFNLHCKVFPLWTASSISGASAFRLCRVYLVGELLIAKNLKQNWRNLIPTSFIAYWQGRTGLMP